MERYSPDRNPHPNTSGHEFDSRLIREYRDLRYQYSNDETERELSETEFLQKLAAVGDEAGKTLPTQSGILFLGSQTAIREHFPQCRIEYFRVPGYTLDATLGQGVLHKTRKMRGPVFQIVREAMREVIDDLPTTPSYPEGSPHRTDFPTVKRRIAREIIGNAVGHRDYSTSASVQICRYANRIEVKNPGDSLVAIEDLHKYESRCRNQAVLTGLQDVNLAEGSGSGVDTLRRKMKDLGLPSPVFRNDTRAQAFTAYLVLTPFDIGVSTRDTDDGLRRSILFYARELGSLNLSIAQSIQFTSEATTGSLLKSLEAEQLLECFELNGEPEYRATDLGASDNVWSKFTHGSDYLTQTGGDSTHSPISHDDLPTMPKNIVDLVSGFGTSRDIRRLRWLILQACSVSQLSARELGAILARNSASLRQHHISYLIDSGFLSFVGSPNSPSLKYSSTLSGRHVKEEELSSNIQ